MEIDNVRVVREGDDKVRDRRADIADHDTADDEHGHLVHALRNEQHEAHREHRAREGGGPSLLECKMVRFYGHFEGDAQTYRAPGELDDIRANHDCLKIFGATVTGAGVITQSELRSIDDQVMSLIEDAVKQAKAAPVPPPSELLTDVYVSY